MNEFDSRLQLMGITTWRLRDVNNTAKPAEMSNSKEIEAVKPSLFCYVLKNTAGKSVGFVLADYIEDAALAYAEQTAWLVKMISAVTPHYASCTLDTISSLSIALNPFFILLGDAAQVFFSAQTFASDCIIQQVSPRDLFSNQEKKKILWDQIKPLRAVCA